jgi:hypothetical protein
MAHVLVRDFTTTKSTRQPKSTFFGTGLKSKNLLFNFVNEKTCFFINRENLRGGHIKNRRVFCKTWLNCSHHQMDTLLIWHVPLELLSWQHAHVADIFLHLRVIMTCLSTFWNHFWNRFWKRGHLRRMFKTLQEKMMTSRMRRCLNLSVSKFWYNDCSFNSFVSLNSLVHFYFFTLFIYLIDFISEIRLKRGHVSRFGYIGNSYEIQAIARVSHHMLRMLQLQCWISKIQIQMKNLAIVPKSIRNAKVFKYIYI